MSGLAMERSKREETVRGGWNVLAVFADTCPHLGNEIGRMGPARLIWEMKKLKKQLPDGDSLD